MITIKKLLAFGVVVASMAFAAKPASAASIVLNFEGLQNGEAVQNFYNGGQGSLGSSGSNYGIVFVSGSLAVIDADAPGGTGNIANEPSGSTALFFLQQTAVMNVAAGFTEQLSFWYSSVSTSPAGTVRVYDGLGATGTVLASVSLPALTGPCLGDPNGAFCNWSFVGVSFDGTARSVSFGGSANNIAFDDVTFGSDRTGAVATPEPGTLLLLGSGIALAVSRLRRRR